MGENSVQSDISLKSGVVLSYVAMAVSLLVAFLYTPLMIRCLGQEEYGLYSLAASVVGYLSLFNFGLGNAVIRFATKLRAENKQKQVESLYGFFIVIFSILAFLVIAASIIIILNVENIFNLSTGESGYKSLKYILIIMTIGLVVNFPTSVYNSIILSYERFLFVKIISIVQNILTPVIMIPLLLSGYKAVSMTIILLALNILCAILNIIYVHTKLKVHIKFDLKQLDKRILRSVFGYTFFIFLGTMVDQIFWNTDKIVLGIFCDEIKIAIYAIATCFHSYYQLFSGSIGDVFFPRITRMVAKENSLQDLSELFIRVGRIQAMVLFLALGGFIVFGKQFIRYWAGAGYDESYWIALLVMAPATIHLTQSVGFLIIKAMNRHQFRALVCVCIALLNIVTSIPAAIKWGGIGCALCTCIATLIGYGAIMNWFYYKKIGLDIPRFWREISKIFVVTVCVTILAWIVDRVLVYDNILIFGLKIIVFSLVYFAVTYKTVMNSYEQELVRGLLRKLGLIKCIRASRI